MSKVTAALETAVAIVIANTPAEGETQTNRQRVTADRAFAGILKLIAPRIRHFVRQYGLVAHWDDAEQVCAIGVHRAIQGYDPAKAQFTTFVNWQLRGELQGLRYRLMTDQRPGAKKVSATTISLHAPVAGGDGDEMTLEATIVDEDALSRTEAAASNHMAGATRDRLIDDYVDHLRTVGIEQLKRRARERAVPERAAAGAPRLRATLYPIDEADRAQLEEKIALHREAIERRLSEDVEAAGPRISDATEDAIRERTRQIAKRAAATIADLSQRGTRFAPALVSVPRKPRARTRTIA